jgi:hypothetical protein
MPRPHGEKGDTALWGVHAAGAAALSAWVTLAWSADAKTSVTLPTLFSCIGITWVALGVAWIAARPISPHRLVMTLWVWAVLFRIIGVLSPPIMEDDWARYLWDGREFARSGNPYATTPAESFSDGTLPERFTRILDEINNPEITTIYGPVCQAVFLFGYWIEPGALWPIKVLLLIVDCLGLWLLLQLVPPRNALLFAWCPLLIFETAFNAHTEVLWITPIIGALCGRVRGKQWQTALCCGLACGAKLFALIIVPFILCGVAWSRWAICAATVVACYAPFWLQRSAADIPALRLMSSTWEFNSTAFAAARAWIGDRAARLSCAATYAAIWGWLCARQCRDWARRRLRDHVASDGISDLPRGDLLFGLLLLFSVVVNPWYALALLPFVTLRPSVWGIATLCVVTSSYAHGLHLAPEHGLAPYEVPSSVRVAECGVVLLAIIVQRLWRLRPAERQRD